MRNHQKLEVGDRVQYSARFLRSISCFTGELPQARGNIVELLPMGQATLAQVDWGPGADDVPQKVLVQNLERARQVGLVDRIESE